MFRGGTGLQFLFSALLNAFCLKIDIASQTLEIFEIWSKMDLFERLYLENNDSHRIKYKEEFVAPSLLYAPSKNKECYNCSFVLNIFDRKGGFKKKEKKNFDCCSVLGL